jgi:chromosome segregation ATPase
MAQRVEGRARIHVENVGGIDEADVTFSPGVTVLSGRNATNRTSLLQALMAGVGSDDVSIKASADEAAVELELDGESYTRRFVRRDGEVVSEGEPYLEDATDADLFAFLLESNEARRAVREGRDLRDIIMRPVDTEEIQDEIDRLLEERSRLDGELDEIDSLKGKLPGLEKRRADVLADIEAKREELAAKEAELEEAEVDIEETQEDKEELEERLSTLSAKRSELEDVRYRLDTERETVESLTDERATLEADLEDLPETPTGDVDRLESRIERLRDERQSLEAELDELQSVIGFNEDMLEGATDDILAAFTRDEASTEDGTEPLTGQLLENDTTACWTCGSEVEASQIERTVDRLRSLSRERFQEIDDIETRLDELTERRRELSEARRERERLETRLDRLETEPAESREEIERLRARRSDLTEEVAAVETAVEQLEGRSYGDVLDLHREANELEYELGRLENDLDGVEDEVERIASRLDEEDELRTRREEVSTEIESLRTRIDRIERRAVEEFNGHMDTLIDLLGYENLKRVWLERTEHEGRQNRRTVQQTAFELHIIRRTTSNTTYEDTVENLSESERKVTGLVLALAGYLAHDLHERVPFMLLDSIEAIDTDRLALLVDYLGEYSDYLVVALLTEDAQGLSDAYERVTEI